MTRRQAGAAELDGARAAHRAHAERFAVRHVSPVGIYPCEGTRDPECAAALERGLEQQLGLATVSRVASLRRDDHAQDDACWLHTSRCCLSTRAPGDGRSGR